MCSAVQELPQHLLDLRQLAHDGVELGVGQLGIGCLSPGGRPALDTGVQLGAPEELAPSGCPRVAGAGGGAGFGLGSQPLGDLKRGADFDAVTGQREREQPFGAA
jgi:hypothetical protein